MMGERSSSPLRTTVIDPGESKGGEEGKERGEGAKPPKRQERREKEEEEERRERRRGEKRWHLLVLI